MRNAKKNSWTVRIAAILVLLALYGQAQAQVPVALAPSVHPQFLDASGKPLSGGFIFTYQSGTTTRQDTYTDSTGSIINAWPIPLDATGAPSNLTTQTGIWLSNQSYKFCGYNSALVQQWCVDNVSSYQILSNIGNITFGGVTSDPTGAAGEIGYRSDLGCFRVYTSFWDCLVTLTGIQTLTNKTLTAPVITNAPSPSFISPTITGLTVGGVSVSSGNPTNFTTFTNDTATGTTISTLTKLKVQGAGSTAVIAATTDTSGIEGITIGGAGISGIDLIQRNGQVLCVFDGATTVLDYVQISSTVAGNCHDTTSTIYPTSGGQVIGRSLSTQAGPGTYLIDLFGPEIQPSKANPVTAVNLTAQAANISSTPILTPAANGFYRFNCYTVVTQAATSSSTLPQCQVLFNDADTNVAETQPVTTINTGNTVGALGGLNATNSTIWLFAKSGVAISYQTSSYASSGATPMQYAIHIRLEGPF